MDQYLNVVPEQLLCLSVYSHKLMLADSWYISSYTSTNSKISWENKNNH